MAGHHTGGVKMKFERFLAGQARQDTDAINRTFDTTLQRKVTYAFCLRLAAVTALTVHPTMRQERATIGLLREG